MLVLLLILLVCIMLLLWFLLRPRQRKSVRYFDAPRHVPRQQAVAARPPEIVRLATLLAAFEKNPENSWDALIAIGDIYRKGAYPRFQPNRDVAARCYRAVSICPNSTMSVMGESRYAEVYEDPVDGVDIAGDHFPESYGMKASAIAEHLIQVQKPESRQQHVQSYPVVPVFVIPSFDFDTPMHRIDPQNVHDHGVTQTTSYNIDKLRNEPTGGVSTDMEEVVNAILEASDVDENTKVDALHVIDNLSDSQHSRFNVSEKDTLSMVWGKIRGHEHRTNLTETLAKQLASGVENGYTVCSSGKIARIVGTLDGVGNETVKPIWAIKDELANMAVRVRDNSNNKEMFMKQAQDEYITKLGMNPKIIDPLINEYMVGFD